MNFFAMNKAFLTLMLAFVGCFLCGIDVSAQDKKEPSMEELAAREADRLAELLDLEDWQVFYVDSTLQHDYAALEAEIKTLRDSKVENPDLYVVVQDKWMDKIFNSFKTFFNEDQWKKYLKSGAGRAEKARAKRRKAAGGE